MSKPFSAFYDHLMPELPGMTTLMLDANLRQVARDFCDRSSAWRDTFDAIEPQADTATYMLDVPESQAELVRLLDMRVGDEWTWSAMDPKPDATDRPKFAPDRPPFTLNAAADEITFDTVPTSTVTLQGAMRPTLGATSLPDVLLALHLEAIRTGVLSRLMRMGNKPWSNVPLAIEYRHDYDAACNRAAYVAARGNVRAQLRTRPTLI